MKLFDGIMKKNKEKKTFSQLNIGFSSISRLTANFGKKTTKESQNYQN